MKVSSLITALGLVLVTAQLSPAKDWRGIVPLVSTRTEVEQILGPRPKAIETKYDFESETVYVVYAMLPCSEWPQPPAGWNVPKNTVVRMLVYPQSRVLVGSLGIDLSSFKKVRGSACVSQDFYYVNDQEGFSIEFTDTGDTGDKRETVFGYDYYPTSEQGKLFHCPA
jgi:hypothetical protein